MRPSVPSSPRPVRRITLSGTAAKSANNDRDGPCENDAGTARMSLGSFDEYVSRSTCGLGKNSRCLEKEEMINTSTSGTPLESAYLNRNAKAPIASSSASSSRLRLLLRFPEVSSPTSSLLTVPPSHSIILRTKVSISRPVRERRHIGNLRRAKDQCWSSNTSNSRRRVLASQGRSREEREERVVVMVSGYEIRKEKKNRGVEKDLNTD